MFVGRFSTEICLNYIKLVERDLYVKKRSEFDSGMKVIKVRDEDKYAVYRVGPYHIHIKYVAGMAHTGVHLSRI